MLLKYEHNYYDIPSEEFNSGKRTLHYLHNTVCAQQADDRRYISFNEGTLSVHYGTLKNVNILLVLLYELYTSDEYIHTYTFLSHNFKWNTETHMK